MDDNRVLVETLLSQKAGGNQAQSGWKSIVWSAVATKLKKIAAGDQVEKTTTKYNDHYANVGV